MGSNHYKNDTFVVNKDKFHRKLVQRLKDMHLQEFRHTPSTRVKDYVLGFMQMLISYVRVQKLSGKGY